VIADSVVCLLSRGQFENDATVVRLGDDVAFGGVAGVDGTAVPLVPLVDGRRTSGGEEGELVDFSIIVVFVVVVFVVVVFVIVLVVVVFVIVLVVVVFVIVLVVVVFVIVLVVVVFVIVLVVVVFVIVLVVVVFVVVIVIVVTPIRVRISIPNDEGTVLVHKDIERLVSGVDRRCLVR